MLTPKQASKIAHAIAEFDAGRLGAMDDEFESDRSARCVYEQGEKHCLAGSMFSRKSLDKIHEAGVNSGTSIDDIASFVPIESETGFSIDQLTVLQAQHDHAFFAGARTLESLELHKRAFRALLVDLLADNVNYVENSQGIPVYFSGKQT